MRRSVVNSIVLLMSPLLGCHGPWSARTTRLAAVSTLPLQVGASADLPAVTATSTAAEPELAEQPRVDTEQAALADVLDELTEVGAIDPTAKRMLIADLRGAKPENWPLIVRQFRSALAYRQQLALRDAERGQETALLQLVAETTSEKTTELLVDNQTTRLSAASPSRASPMAAAPNGNRATDARPSTVAAAVDIRALAPRQNRQRPTAAVGNNLPTAAAAAAPLAVSQPSQYGAQQVSYAAASGSPVDWQGHLHRAIDDLQASVQPLPESTDEVNDHLRLRLLQLLAGNQEAALGSVPGASAEQQDFWNQQLFAISTFLDSAGQPDDKRRAAASLIHLDQARAKLAELATMQVRKLTFVDSVAGYGAYRQVEAAKFRPGDQVTLYAEIENFRSESTKEGYRTQLGTSYEVVDKNGKRVDSAQFPEVVDLCQNPRRDFHMQYTVTLPTRIYPEHYELRLNVTDQQSQKIGQASVSFEITD